MTTEIVFRPSAIEDLESIEAYVAANRPKLAAALIDRLQMFCRRLSTFPESGAPRDDLAPGTRMLVFERRIVVLYRIESGVFLILAFVYAGRDLQAVQRESGETAD